VAGVEQHHRGHGHAAEPVERRDVWNPTLPHCRIVPRSSRIRAPAHPQVEPPGRRCFSRDILPGDHVAPPEPPEQRQPDAPARPYRGPDRRGVARFVIPALPPTIALMAIALAWILAAPHLDVHLSASTLVELS